MFYAALEGLYGVMGDRRKAWCIVRGVEDGAPNFHALPAPLVFAEEERADFIEQIRLRCAARADRQMPRLIVLETYSKMIPGQNEDSSGVAAVVHKFCAELVETFGCSVIMVHHKSDKAGAADIRGSSGIAANFDTVIRVSADKTTKTATVAVRKHKDAPERETPWHLQGHAVGPSLVFQPITAAEHKEKVKGTDPLARQAVGAALMQLKAIGEKGRVTTTVLARTLFPHQPDQSEPDWLTVTTNATRRLNERAGGSLDVYAHKGAAGTPTWWYLPDDET